MTLEYFRDAVSMATIKAEKEQQRYAIERMITRIWRVRPIRFDEESDIYVEPDGTLVEKK
jgi:hypothetical protein